MHCAVELEFESNLCAEEYLPRVRKKVSFSSRNKGRGPMRVGLWSSVHAERMSWAGRGKGGDKVPVGGVEE